MLHMDLLVAYKEDPAGRNMAAFLADQMTKDGKIYRGDSYDMATITSPAISADWLESEFAYDRYVFLSRHSAESGRLALTCHSTGNFTDAVFGGNPQEVAIPYTSLLKRYMKKLWSNRTAFDQFHITLEATHHGPTALSKPCIFVEIGTTTTQWNDVSLCNMIATILHQALVDGAEYPAAIGFGGTHYPEAFTKMTIHGEYALGTIVPKRALEYVDERMLNHIISRNYNAQVALLDWRGMGKHRENVLNMLEQTDLQVIRI